MSDTVASPGDEVARLRAERDELRAKVDTLTGRSRDSSWWRRTGAAVLVVLASLSFLAAVPGVWARRNFLDTDRFVSRVAPLADDPAVQEALTIRLTDQLMVLIDPRALFEEVLPERGRLLAVPLANAVEGFVRDRVESFIESDTFAELWSGAARVAHETAVKVLKGESDVVGAEDGTVTLNLVPVVNAVLAQITSATPEILGREVDLPDVTVDDIPEAAISRLEEATGVELDEDFGQLTIYDDGKLEAAQEAVKTFDRLVVVLFVLSFVLAAAALWVSHRRRRTLLQLTVGVMLGMVLVRRVGFGLEDEIAALPPTEPGQDAAAVAVGNFLDPLTTFAMWAFAAAAIVAAIAFLSGGYAWAVSLRSRGAALATDLVSATSRRAQDETTVAWITQHHDALLAAGAFVGLLVLWSADLSWFGLLVVLALVVAFEAVVHRIGSGGPPEPQPGAAAG